MNPFRVKMLTIVVYAISILMLTFAMAHADEHGSFIITTTSSDSRLYFEMNDSVGFAQIQDDTKQMVVDHFLQQEGGVDYGSPVVCKHTLHAHLCHINVEDGVISIFGYGHVSADDMVTAVQTFELTQGIEFDKQRQMRFILAAFK